MAIQNSLHFCGHYLRKLIITEKEGKTKKVTHPQISYLFSMLSEALSRLSKSPQILNLSL